MEGVFYRKTAEELATSNQTGVLLLVAIRARTLPLAQWMLRFPRHLGLSLKQ